MPSTSPIHSRAEVHFHQQDLVSIFWESDASESWYQWTNEWLFFCVFAVFQINRLDPSFRGALEGTLSLIAEEEGVLEELANGHDAGDVKLIPFPGTPGRKSFAGELRFDGDGAIHFNLADDGFGLFKRGLDYYAPTSVIALLRFFSQRRISEPIFLQALRHLCNAFLAEWQEAPTLTLEMAANAVSQTIASLRSTLKQEAALAPSTTTQYDTTVDAASLGATPSRDTIPADTILVNDPKFERLGKEFNEHLGRADGVMVAKSLAAHFEQDLRDWFYDRIFPHFRDLPQSEWSEMDQITSEVNCRRTISFFQSVRGAMAALADGYTSAFASTWFANWLLQLNLGAVAGEEASRVWLPQFLNARPDQQAELVCAALGQQLPDTEEKRAILELYFQTFDMRIRATVIRGFGNDDQASKIYASAVQIDNDLDVEFRDYATGGDVAFSLEGEHGFLLTETAEKNRVFQLWTEHTLAERFNKEHYNGSLRLAVLIYRQLEENLLDMRSTGIHFVVLDRSMAGSTTIAPIDEVLKHVRRTIEIADSNRVAVALKRLGNS